MALPKAAVNVDAPDGTEILVDGASVGTAPLTGLMVQIGTHDISGRRPDGAERHQPVEVKAGAVSAVTLE